MNSLETRNLDKLLEIIKIGIEGSPRQADTLIRHFGHPDKAVRWASWVALAKLGDDVLPALKPLKDHPNRNTRWSYVEALAKLRTAACIPLLLEALEDSEPIVRREAVEGLGKSRDPRGLPAILNMLRDPHVEVRRHAIGALSAFRDRVMVRSLLTALRDPDSMVRGKAASLLINLGPLAAAALDDEELTTGKATGH